MKELFPYQIEALNRITRHEQGGALFMEPGLGKTITAIRAATRVKAHRVVVVCPVVAVGVWRWELGDDRAPSVHVPTGTRAEKAAQINEVNKGWIILNYEALLDKKVLDALQRFDPDLVVLDESHKVKNPTAKRSKACHKLTDGRRTFILTGTPITQNLADLYSQFKCLSPAIWDHESWTRWKQRHAIFGGFEGREIVGFRDPDQIRDRIRPFTFAMKNDGRIPVPRTTYEVPVYVTGKDWEQYRQLADTGVNAEYETTNPLEAELRKHQTVGRLKVPYTIDLAMEILERGEKVIVFYKYLEEGRALQEAFQGKYPTSHIWGGVSADDRGQIVEHFQRTPGPAVFIGQISAAGVAITLTAASEVIYHSMSWSYEDLVQSRDRVYRIGQTKPVRYQIVTAVGPQGGKLVDGRILDAMRNKSSYAAEVMKHPEIVRDP